MFDKYNVRKELIDDLVCRVDDILFTGDEAELRITGHVLRKPRTGDMEKLPHQPPIIFDGALLGRHGAAG